MKRTLIISVTLCFSILFLGWFIGPTKSKTSTTSIDTLTFARRGDSSKALINYQNFCGGCHGEKMDAFVDRDWKHGNKREDLFKAIKNGYSDEGMPAFDSAFSTEDIYALSDYILTGIENVKRFNFQDKPVQKNFFPADGFALKLDTVVRGLNSIWGMAFLPKNRMLITERSGDIYLIEKDRSRKKVSGGPEVLNEGQGGLLDVVLDPAFTTNKLVYFSYSAFKKTDNSTLSTTAVMRARLEGTQLLDRKIIFEALPYSRTRHHYGSRMIFGRDGDLYISVGERGNEKENPQSLANDLGKIHRIKSDGSIPSDNPFVNTPGAKASIYSYGHRNPQGLTLDPVTGQIWSNEHGPRGGDEINIVKKGMNYGWPLVTYGINYDGRIISTKSVQEGIEPPLLYWIPSIGPSGMTIVQGNRYKNWKGAILSGSLRFKYLNLSRFSGTKMEKEEILLKNIGRLRDVRMGPDGYIYISVEEPGYVFRLIPVSE